MADETEQGVPKSALVPLQERSVDFYGDQVVAVLVDAEGRQEVYVPLRPICEYLGLNWAGQLQRMKRDPILAEALRFVVIMHTNPTGGNPNVQALPLKLLPGWLFGITTAKVRPEMQDKITRYRRECFDVLWRAFQSELASEASGTDLAVLRQVREMGRAIMQLADQQISYQMQTNTRLDRAAEIVKALDRRVSSVERKLAAGPITEEQAAEISARVKALAEYLTSKQPGQVHYQAIFGELYRRFGVASYKAIPIDEYENVLRFLDDWRRAAT